MLLLVAVIPAFLSETHFNDKFYALAWGQTSDRRELDYIRFLGASDESVKEVKIFNLSNYLVERFRRLSDKFYKDKRDLSVRYNIWAVMFAIVGSAGYYGQRMRSSSCAPCRASCPSATWRSSAVRSASCAACWKACSCVLPALPRAPFTCATCSSSSRSRRALRSLLKQGHFPKPIREGFTFENVGFKYLHAERWANRHLSFTLSAGEKLALVGENGAGKTTLVKLLARLYDPTEGRILLDGYDLREYDLAELRMQVGVIFQDFQRYQMTFSQNIAVGNIAEIGNPALIENAAQKSMADELTGRLPGKYEQMLGRRFNNGIELSGGEWQKIALARAYMKNAQLLILDEPTAALDARAEYEVFLRFADLTRGKSAVLISHRFSTVRMADRILVLERGELLEIGSHDELLAKNGRYAELFHLQAQGYR